MDEKRATQGGTGGATNTMGAEGSSSMKISAHINTASGSPFRFYKCEKQSLRIRAPAATTTSKQSKVTRGGSTHVVQGREVAEHFAGGGAEPQGVRQLHHRLIVLTLDGENGAQVRQGPSVFRLPVQGLSVQRLCLAQDTKKPGQ